MDVSGYADVIIAKRARSNNSLVGKVDDSIVDLLPHDQAITSVNRETLPFRLDAAWIIGELEAKRLISTHTQTILITR